MSKLALDHVERHALACRLDGVGVTQLMWGEAAPDAGMSGEAPELSPGSRG